MPSYQHKKLVEAIERLDELPPDPEDFAVWIEADTHLGFLRENAGSDELVISASGEYSFVYAAVVPNSILASVSQADLLHWFGDPYRTIASYVWGGSRDDVSVERHEDEQSRGLTSVIALVFGRTFEGWSGSEASYFEINQEYSHLTGIHWRPEHRSYCRFDGNGDLEHVVSITHPVGLDKRTTCVSFAWVPLEQYLAARNATLVRRFDFTLLHRAGFTKWPEGPEKVVNESDRFFYRQKVDPGVAAYTTGIQLISPRRRSQTIFAGVRGNQQEQKHVGFLAFDWRNRRVSKISTDPASTTNYFEAHKNALPFEMSPAFFKPEVILKYKMDKEKYTVGERDIRCRAAWRLQAFDVNEAGQVFAYIRYLRELPAAELGHWQSYNELPKAGISERARVNDFEGDFTTYRDPLQEVLAVLVSWRDSRVRWWTMRDARLFERVSTPLTSSRDEWGGAFMDLSKLVVEGPNTREIRRELDGSGIAYNKDEQSIVLLERLVSGRAGSLERQRLNALRTVQFIRSKVQGHASGQEADAFIQEVIAEHGNFTKHFRHVCGQVALELQMIAGAFE